jgi:hypothetical protein
MNKICEKQLTCISRQRIPYQTPECIQEKREQTNAYREKKRK